MKYSTFTFAKTLLSIVLISLLASCGKKKKSLAELGISLKDDVTFLASDSLEGREIGTEGEHKAATYIAGRFASIGLSPAGTDGFFQKFEVTPAQNPHEQARVGATGDSLTIEGTNIIGMIDSPGDEIIIIGAHYDHLGYGGMGSLYRGDSLMVHNGADDNASGVAVLLQLATLLKEGPLQKDILFIAFSGEEEGLWGSNYFTKNPTVDLGKVSAMINMDMVGRLNEQKVLAIHGTGTSPVWEDMLNKANADSIPLLFRPSGVGPSDHTSFYLQDIPVLHFFTGQHEDYHRPSDDSEKLNYEGMAKITLMIDRVVGELNTAEKPAFTKTKDESSDAPRFTVTLGVVPDYLFGGKGMRIDGITDGKPASVAGLQKGDIVVQLGDFAIDGMNGYMEALSKFEKGAETTVKVKRDDEELTFPIKF
ncbi:MAG: M28 family peptidase [Cyclobacteriaceae bacterium]|nr:M28 family peptidase [Cyclobacteriaceae bacterium]MCB0499668.1 M28 family peptidase [Cyclobacteriaceae bacterium]MCB9239407.1 M28 family peptidase [Flammeovirgaceae bacterium]MCO5271210.1 M28 family peptidase [Cyclobacteriaceae bacterium]MCW5902584.1 M28 family peptidase [Cyclobacteriaceae bacterium]